MDSQEDKDTYKLTISYDGTNYGGWQVQPNAVTVQELLQHALKTILKEEIHATGSGRTDAGVHARRQVAHLHVNTAITAWQLRANLNDLLPKDIRVIEVEKAPEGFHARYSATGKIYRYYLDLGEVATPFERLYSWHIPRQFDIEKAILASSYFIGTHDFASFANEAHLRQGKPRGTVRTIRRFDHHRTEQGLFFEIEGDGFLYKMVRNMIGTIALAARGKIPPECIPELLLLRDRKAVGAAAPPQGLFLWDVHYS